MIRLTKKYWYIGVLIGLLAGFAVMMFNPVGTVAQYSGSTPPRWAESITDNITDMESDLDTIEVCVQSIRGWTDSEIATIDGIVDNIYLGTWRIARCTTPDGSATAWTQAAHNMFSVTGPCLIRPPIAYCFEDLVGAGTIEFGEATGGTDLLIDQVADATTLDANEIWCGITADVTATMGAIGAGETYGVGSCTLELVVGTANITNGSIAIYIPYLPLRSAAKIDSVEWD